jgi:hypothetical protein
VLLSNNSFNVPRGTSKEPRECVATSWVTNDQDKSPTAEASLAISGGVLPSHVSWLMFDVEIPRERASVPHRGEVTNGTTGRTAAEESPAKKAPGPRILRRRSYARGRDVG